MSSNGERCEADFWSLSAMMLSSSWRYLDETSSLYLSGRSRLPRLLFHLWRSPSIKNKRCLGCKYTRSHSSSSQRNSRNPHDHFEGRPNFPVTSRCLPTKIRLFAGRMRPNFLVKAAKHFYHLHDVMCFIFNRNERTLLRKALFEGPVIDTKVALDLDHRILFLTTTP